MNSQIFLSRFTPSLMTPEVLERIFVQRGDIAEHLVGIVRDSVLTPAKHHTLVLGPRGIGKTHLLSLVHHRIAKQEDLQDRMRIAWLREEEWGVSSFLDLLHRILRTLAATYKDKDLHAQTEKLFSLSTRTAERKAGDLLRSFLDGRALVLMAENLDDMFSGLGKKEQHRFRAYLQEEESWTIVATAQGLFAGVSLHESPFYGFFEVHHLQELSVDDAALLVMNIARLSEDEELATFVQSSEGRARIRAIHHLAGGNHRVYVILSEFLTREALDELVDPFLKAMDDLTPYYQARMAQLSSQQRKMIDFLCETRGAVPVKQIAQRCFMTPQTASSQLKDLREKGYVRSTPIGRDSYYELTEPLMRIALEVKKQREGPVRLFLDFLRYWYSREELAERLTHVQPHVVLERGYLQRVLEEHGIASDDAVVAENTGQILHQLAVDDLAGALQTAERLVELRSDAGSWSMLSYCLNYLGRSEEALNAANRALSADAGDVFSLVLKSWSLADLARATEALEILESALPLSPNEQTEARIHDVRGVALWFLGRREEALQAFNQSLHLAPSFYRAMRRRGQLLLELGRYSEAVAAFEQLIASDAMEREDWGWQGQALEHLGRFEEALDSFDRQLAGDPDSVVAWLGRGRVLRAMERYHEALDAFSRANTLAPADAGVWLELGETYNVIGDPDQALDAFQVAHQGDPSSTGIRLVLTYQLLSLGRYDQALHSAGTPDISNPEHHALAFGKVGAYCGLDLLEEAQAVLESMLRAGSADVVDRTAVGSLLMEVIGNRGGEAAQRRWVSMLVESYTEHGAASQLAAGLVSAITGFIPPNLNPQSASEWLDLWREIAGPYPEFDMPLRLLAAAGVYQQSGDERVLMVLPAEERAILEEVLGSIAPPRERPNDSHVPGRATKGARRRRR
jgi:tetratricopeptide (TPR) repeat protein